MLDPIKSTILLSQIIGEVSNLTNSMCVCASSMLAFTLTEGIGGTSGSCGAQCLQNPVVACSGVLAMGITTVVPLLPPQNMLAGP